MVAERTNTFGTLLRRFRTAACLTQERLAERAGLSVYGIQKLERGSRTRIAIPRSGWQRLSSLQARRRSNSERL